jgi:replicative DNA helicase
VGQINTEIDSEMAVLGCIMRDRSAMDVVVPILDNPAMFTDRAHGTIYRAALRLYHDAKPTDLTSIKSELMRVGEFDRTGRSEKLIDLNEIVLAGTALTANVGHYAGLIKEKYTRARIISVCIEFARSAESDISTPSSVLLNNWQQAAFEIGEGFEAQGFIPLCDDNDAWCKRVDQFQTGEAFKGRIQTGFPKLDRVTSGFAPGELIVVAGETGSGKTQFALQVAYNVAFAQDHAAGIFSLEMDAEELNARIQCFAAGVDYSESVKTPGALTREQYDRITIAAAATRVKKIFLETSPLTTPPVLLARVRRLKSQHDVKLLIVDYLQLMDTGGNEDSREQAVSGAARWLKLIAKELRITVICLSQITPAQGGGLGSLRESRAIGHHADKVIYVVREDGVDVVEGHIVVKKQRSGKSGNKIAMTFANGQWRETDNYHKEL